MGAVIAKGVVNCIIVYKRITVSSKQKWIQGSPPSRKYLAYDSLFRGGKAANIRKKRVVTAEVVEKELRDFKLLASQARGKKIFIDSIKCHEYGSSTSGHFIIHMHGGAYIGGSSTTLSGFCTRVSRVADAKVISVDYSLAPEHPVPICVNEVLMVYLFLIRTKNVQPKHIALTGDSAGGGLTLLSLQEIKRRGLPQPSCAVPVSPWADLSGSQESVSCDIMNERDPMLDKDGVRTLGDIAAGNIGRDNKSTGLDLNLQDPSVSPLFGSFDGLCPLFIMAGGAEILVDEATACHEKAVASGVDSRLEVAPNMFHIYPMFAGCFPEADAAADRLASFIKQRFSQ